MNTAPADRRRIDAADRDRGTPGRRASPSSPRSPCACSRRGRSKTLGIRLVRGRDFAAADDGAAPPVVLISEAMARRFWPGEDAVGKRLTLTFYPGVVREVVGVVADVKLRGLSQTQPIAAIYVPHAQMPRYTMSLLVRTSQSPRSLAGALEAAVHAIDPEQPVEDIKTMEEQPRRVPRARALQHAAARRVRRPGAAALGRRHLQRAVLQRPAAHARDRHPHGARRATDRTSCGSSSLEGMRPALVGLAIGLAASLALGRALESLVFGIRATDPLTFAVVTGAAGPRRPDAPAPCPPGARRASSPRRRCRRGRRVANLLVV